MYRKKLMQAALAGALVATIGTSANVPVVKAAETAAVDVAETEDETSEEETEETETADVEEETEETETTDVEEETEEAETADVEEEADVETESVEGEDTESKETTVTMKIRFVDEDGNFISGGDQFLPEGIQNRSILEQYVPEGYEMTESGDFEVKEGASLDVTVRKISKDVIMKIRFVDEDGNFIGGGDQFLPEGIQNRSILEQTSYQKAYRTILFWKNICRKTIN